MTDALSPVTALVRRHDRDRFHTALFAPAERRAALLALYAFNYEVAKTREMVRETALGHMRLQWWRESIAAIYEGGAVRHHQVVAPLAAAIAAQGLSRAYFDALIDAREADLDDAAPADLDALEAYVEATSGGLVVLALEALGVRAAAAVAAGREVGIAYGLAGLMRSVPFHARARRLYLPSDLVAARGIDLERTLFALKPAPALAAIVAAVAARAKERLDEAHARRSDVPRDAMPALLPGVLAARDLRQLARVRFDPFAPRVARPDGNRIVALTLAALRRRY